MQGGAGPGKGDRDHFGSCRDVLRGTWQPMQALFQGPCSPGSAEQSHNRVTGPQATGTGDKFLTQLQNLL